VLHDLMARLLRNRDFYAGGLLVLIGLVAVTVAPGYGIGTPMRMRPGFFPTALGVILILLGIAITGTGLAQTREEQVDALSKIPDKIEWRGWTCVLGGPVAFVLLGQAFGLIPAAFGCVFVSALGDKTSTIKGAAILAVIVSVLGAFFFSHLMRVPFPMLEWRL
jgi:sulfite exporter TauE/SafE